MLGCGPGALPSDAYMLGIEPVHLRRRMEESLDAIIRLLAGDERCRCRPTGSRCVRRNCISRPIPTRASTSPSPARSRRSAWSRPAGTGSACWSIGAGLPGGPEAMASQWKIAEDTAAQHGKTMNRKDWRIVVGMHIAEDDEEALRQVKAGERQRDDELFRGHAGRCPVPRTIRWRRGQGADHLGRLARDGDPGHRALAGGERRRVWRGALPRA